MGKETCPQRVSVDPEDPTHVELTAEVVAPFRGRYVTIWYPIPKEEYEALVRELQRDAGYKGPIPPPIGSLQGVFVGVRGGHACVDWGYGVPLDGVSTIEVDEPEEGLAEYLAMAFRTTWRSLESMEEILAGYQTRNMHLRRALREAGRTRTLNDDEGRLEGGTGSKGAPTGGEREGREAQGTHRRESAETQEAEGGQRDRDHSDGDR